MKFLTTNDDLICSYNFPAATRGRPSKNHVRVQERNLWNNFITKNFSEIGIGVNHTSVFQIISC